MTGCPDEDELVRLVEGALADESLAQVEAHVDGCDRCTAVLASLGALGATGERRVGRYQLDRRIASGGMGEVWAAWDPELRREIAVKLVRPDRAVTRDGDGEVSDSRERERLLREARALARLTHPNVLAVYDVGEVDGEVFIATELVAGDTLANRGGASADWRMLAGLYSQAARGLAAAHAAGLVHRDVKPANLLLGSDGRVRVADFGLAVRAKTPMPPSSSSNASAGSREPSVTATGHIAGTPAYMAPEQRTGAPADARVDQYALCVALVEAIVGRRPPSDAPSVDRTGSAGDRDALIAFVAERRTREPELDALCGVIARGLAVDPAARHSDAGALADAIDAVIAPKDSATVATNPPTSPRRTGIAIVALVAVAGIGAFAISRRSTDSQAASGSAVVASVNPDAESARAGSDSISGRRADADAPPTTTAAAPIVAADRGADGPASDRKTRASVLGRSGSASNTAAGSGSSNTTGSDLRSGDPGSIPTPGGSVPATTTLDAAVAAIDRHDGKACRAAIAQLPATLPDRAEDERAAAARAACEMTAGNCDGGLRMFTDRFPMPPAGAQVIADQHCPPGTDPAVRLRRLVQQTLHRNSDNLACAYYVPIARAARQTAQTDNDKLTVATVMVALARCFSSKQQCDEAQGVLAEAVALNPRLGQTELPPACRR